MLPKMTFLRNWKHFFGVFQGAKVGHFGPKHVPRDPFHHGKEKWFWQPQLIVCRNVLWFCDSRIWTNAIAAVYGVLTFLKYGVCAPQDRAWRASKSRPDYSCWLAIYQDWATSKCLQFRVLISCRSRFITSSSGERATWAELQKLISYSCKKRRLAKPQSRNSLYSCNLPQIVGAYPPSSTSHSRQ